MLRIFEMKKYIYDDLLARWAKTVLTISCVFNRLSLFNREKNSFLTILMCRTDMAINTLCI